MLYSLTFLEKIILEPPVHRIYSRMGFKKQSTTLSSSQKNETDHNIREAASLIFLQGLFHPIPVLQNNGQTVELAGGLSFTSRKLAAFLADCREAVLLGATAGHAIMDAIREKTEQGHLTAAVVYDATASEMVDGALDWMMDYINRQLRREGKHLLSRRFSAGYADFALSNQKTVYEKLQMDKAGVTLSPDYILCPEKSVTAICGVREQTELDDY